MSWITRRSELQEHDWDLLDLSPQRNEAFKISRPSEAPQSGDTCSLGPINGPNLQTKRHFLACDDDVRQWLYEGDMALSVTFFPGSVTTNAVWYGCDLSKRKFHGDLIIDSELICDQLENFDGGVFHPMVLPVMFAGFEREKHIGTARKCLTQFVQRIHDLAHQDLRSMNGNEGSMRSESD
ncbi:hypothetical protein Focb16_v012771 [Fusarium oxysporum f. sp. cubense]|uniref:Uncharacterized protein n=1 Tax=Fusarium oxysporum f. sp. cubense TaxID=61366 RepID=A0A559LF25_FUSOC|nr:hypothetical protein Focb16_v012771 [Fusarium oxysporum f. sp. cubense]